MRARRRRPRWPIPVAVRLAIYPLPEAARQAEGRDPRLVLARAAGLGRSRRAAGAAELLRRCWRPCYGLCWGWSSSETAIRLPLLGLAMSLLAVGQPGPQYMLALFQYNYLLLAAMVALEPFLLAAAPAGLESFAAMVLVVQTVRRPGMVLCLVPRRPRPRRRPRRRSRPGQRTRASAPIAGATSTVMAGTA